MSALTIEHTTPYRWPYDGRIDPQTLALVLCGTGPRWAEATPTDPEKEQHIAALRDVAANLGLLTVLVRHEAMGPRPPTDQVPGTTISGGTSGTGTISACEPLRAGRHEFDVTAAGTDGFFGSPLDHLLSSNGRTHLLIAGYGFETAVHSTLRRANDRGYECLTVADACLSIDPALRTGSISSIEFSGGIFGAIGSTGPVLDALRTIESPTNTTDDSTAHDSTARP